MEIDESELFNKVKIGAGKSGVVYKATYNGKEVAWKIFAQKDADMEETIRDFCQELTILGRISHPNIVKFIGYNLKYSLSIIMELLPGRNLDDALQPYERDKTLCWQLLIKIALDIIQALHYLHSLPQKVSHNDLKPDNIMVFDFSFDAEVSVKLVDFGFSIFTHSEENVLSRDIKSFSSMFKGIIKYYCDVNHPSASISHNNQEINLAKSFTEIIDDYQSHTSETLEFAVMKLYNTIQSSKLNSSSASALKCSDVVFLRYVANEVINPPALPIIINTAKNHCYVNHFIYKWINETNLKMIENFFLYADINIIFEENMETALIIAVKLGNIDVINFLFTKQNIDVNITDSSGLSALHTAALDNNYRCIKLLLDHPSIRVNLGTAAIDNFHNLNPLEVGVLHFTRHPQQFVRFSCSADRLILSGAKFTKNSADIPNRLGCIESNLLAYIQRYVQMYYQIYQMASIANLLYFFHQLPGWFEQYFEH